jgi:hypothetical protein
MKMTRAISGVAITAVALSLVLVGCGSKSTNKSGPTTTTAKAGTASVAPSTQNAAGPNPNTAAPNPNTTGPFPNTANEGPNPTIATYIQDNHIQETPIHKGDPGAPNINLPVPQGWVVAPGSPPDWAYGGAIVYTGPEAAEYTPRIVALLFKLAGNVDPNKILGLTPGELNNLNGYKAISRGGYKKLAGHDGFQAAGLWADNAQTKAAAIKSVAIPANDGLYVLQIKADGLEDQLKIVAYGTKDIDDRATIS